jgi:hypothetical protein
MGPVKSLRYPRAGRLLSNLYSGYLFGNQIAGLASSLSAADVRSAFWAMKMV